MITDDALGESVATCSLDELAELVADAADDGLPLPRRARKTMEVFLCALSKIFRKRLGGEMELKLTDYRAAVEDENPWQLQMQFRIFQSSLWILIPCELVEELTALLLKRPRNLVLARPGKEEITALCYLFASILAEEPLFSAQQIYLAAVNGGELENVQSRIGLSITVALGGSEYLLRIDADPRLLERVVAFSRCAAGTDAYSIAASKINCAEFKLSLRLALKSPLELLSLGRGNVLPIVSPVWSLTPRSSAGAAQEIRLTEIGSTDTELRFQC